MAFVRSLRLRLMQAKDETPLAVAAGTPASLTKLHTGCRRAHIMLGSAMEWQQGMVQGGAQERRGSREGGKQHRNMLAQHAFDS
jgi:hypothetical protein